MIKHFILSIILFLVVNLANATIAANVDRNSIELGQTFTLSIDISNSSDTPEVDSLRNNFDIYGTSSSSQMSIINGHTSSQKMFIVTLSPKNPGKQLIPAIKVGNDFTAPISIDVAQGQNTSLATANSTAKVFVDASLANSTGYVGVPVVYSIKLYYTVALNNVSMGSLDIKDAQIQPSGKDIRYTSTIKGQQYEVIEQKFLLTPNKPGNINIPAAKISGAMMDTNPNNFIPFARPINFNVLSKPLTLKVLAIPNNDGQSFAAKALNISDSWSINQDNLKIGQPITRIITLEANGVPYTSIPELKLDTPNGVNVYPDKTVTDTSVVGDNLIGKKTFKLVYIPTNSGTLNFPEVKIKWWDINNKTEKTAILAAKSYTVLNDSKSVSASSAVIRKVSTPNTTTTTSLWFYVAIGILLLWIISMVIVVALFKKKPLPTTVISKTQKNHALLKKACQNKDIKALNQALIRWASAHWDKKIYTISDIQDIANNKILSDLIDKLNLALYKGYPFDEFDLLLEQINTLARPKIDKSKQFLKELYPK
jgi:hypothetical protein